MGLNWLKLSELDACCLSWTKYMKTDFLKVAFNDECIGTQDGLDS